ncbi:MAG: cardiolipin synthase [Butyricicoccus sp.]
MRSEQKSDVKNSIGRLTFVGLSILAQLAWILFLVIRLNRYSAVISTLSSVMALVVVLTIYGKKTNSAFKMPWIMLILAFPVLGLCLYLLFGHQNATRTMRERFLKIHKTLLEQLHKEQSVLPELEQRDMAMANQCRYLENVERYPLCRNTEVVFYAEAEQGFRAQLDAIRQAKKFIFLDYHAIEEAKAFEQMRRELAQKAAEGVEVRILYDDVGSIGFVNLDFIRRMESCGIRCKVFNPVMPVLKIFMNHRDHRKITVIDGEIGFTGGYNLADEYFNITHPYGMWKDTGVRLTGEAVRSLTAMFLEMWNCSEKKLEATDKYLIPAQPVVNSTGYVQPYADHPMGTVSVGENVYLNLIKQSTRFVYITTPYLIISDEMGRELTMAAQRGVDVRIITPGIPDKKVIYRVTRSYYADLASHGVRIYEYTPGFLHAKQMLSDGVAATVGTINLDYRSLYHHFENGVLLYQCPAVQDIQKDFEQCFSVSREVTEQYRNNRRLTVPRGIDLLFRLVSPLL